MPEPVDAHAAPIETRGPADYRVQLWTAPAIVGQGACASFDFSATEFGDVVKWARAESTRRAPCQAEVLLKYTHPTGQLETIEVTRWYAGAPGGEDFVPAVAATTPLPPFRRTGFGLWAFGGGSDNDGDFGGGFLGGGGGDFSGGGDGGGGGS